MTIYDLEGNEIQAPEPEEPPQKRRDYKPAPGRVTVLRQKLSDKYNEELDIAKAVDYAERDNNFSIYATVAVVGDQLPNGIKPFFERGDTVTIIPSMFDEVQLSDNLTVWAGPFSAVTGVFVEQEGGATE